MTSHLKGVVVCVAGDLNHDADDHQWTNENIKRWLELRGGKFVDEMNDSVTHLLCSRAAFKTKEAEGGCFIPSLWENTPIIYSKSDHIIRIISQVRKADQMQDRHLRVAR